MLFNLTLLVSLIGLTLSFPTPIEHNEQVLDTVNYTVTEGDILLPISGPKNGRLRNAIMGNHYLWPGKTLVYQLSPNFDQNQRWKIDQAMATISHRTGNCIRFKRRTTEQIYANMVDGKGCNSFVGRQQWAAQVVNLDAHCFRQHTLIHEMMHALGVQHEHNRYDRDRFVDIVWSNVQPDQKYNFEISPLSQYTVYRPFDFMSTMLYESNAFAKSPHLVTIRSKVAGQSLLDWLYKPVMSDGDVITLKKLYKC